MSVPKESGVAMVLADGGAGLDFLGVLVLGCSSVLTLLAVGVLFKCIGFIGIQDRDSGAEEAPRFPRRGSFSQRHC